MTAKWVGADDAEYVSIGGGSIVTTSGTFRASYADCAMQATTIGNGHQSFKPYAETDFWFSARICTEFYQGNTAGAVLFEFLSADLLPRIGIVPDTSGGSTNWKVVTVDHLGTAVQIGNAFYWSITRANGKGDKVDIHVNYDVAGSIDIYINFVHVFAFVGDCTTDGETQLAYHRLGGNLLGNVYWSETWIDDEDTRAQSLPSWRPVANGNANTFGALSTGGASAAANINEIALNVGTLNASDSAGQIDQYTNGAVPTATLDVKDVIISAYAQKGTSGPTKLALGVRTGGTDYWGSDQPLAIVWQNIQEVFSQNPNTSAEWIKTQIGNASGFNVGAKSAA